MKVEFIKAGTAAAHYPPGKLPEVAFVGRSNAGKSSFINGLLNQSVSKVSATPGKTRTINFFNVGDFMQLVDLPGYGFAVGDEKEVQSWKKMIETYLRTRENLRGVLLIMDIRRGWDDEEEMMRDWLSANKIPWGVVLNKADKLSRGEATTRMKAFKEELGDVPLYMVSALKKQGFEAVKRLVLTGWAK